MKMWSTANIIPIFIAPKPLRIRPMLIWQFSFIMNSRITFWNHDINSQGTCIIPYYTYLTFSYIPNYIRINFVNIIDMYDNRTSSVHPFIWFVCPSHTVLKQKNKSGYYRNVLLGETNAGNLLIFSLHTWVRLQVNFFPHSFLPRQRVCNHHIFFNNKVMKHVYARLWRVVFSFLLCVWVVINSVL